MLPPKGVRPKADTAPAPASDGDRNLQGSTPPPASGGSYRDLQGSTPPPAAGGGYRNLADTEAPTEGTTLVCQYIQ
jgi:hypothetical protein